jgi:branched-chain amino acid transport system ATP-binding protein
LLEVKDMSVSYGVGIIVEEINIKVEKGETVALLGPNGAGKSTILRAVSGMINVMQSFGPRKPYVNGAIIFNNERIEKLKPYEIVKKGLVHCPERSRLFNRMSVLENLEMGAYPINDKSKVKAKLEEVFQLFPVLKETKDRRVTTLSGGERQMVTLGRALMADPKMLLIDEPSFGLAPKFKDVIFDTINKIREETSVGILMVEQDVTRAFSVMDRGYLLENGKIVVEGNKEELSKDKRVKKVYLGI